jgi:hypothetical protein
MADDRVRLVVVAVLILALAIIVVFSVRGLDQTSPPPTVDIGIVRTEAVETFAQGLTGTAHAVPTSTITATLTEGPTEAITETAGADSVSSTPSCYRMKFVRDVTIPDNTPMTPAQVFTKAWQVENNGICAWHVGFKLVLIGGLAMGGSPFTLAATVNPGGRIDIAIKMVAPTNQTGIVEGTWRMSDDNGTPFGDALTVVIVVGGTTSPAPTLGATATP